MSVHQVSRAGTSAPGTIGRIGEPAAIERQAAAADTLREAGLQSYQLGHACFDASGPAAGQLRPVPPLRDAVARQLRELRADLPQRQPDALCEHDERDTSNDRA